MEIKELTDFAAALDDHASATSSADEKLKTAAAAAKTAIDAKVAAAIPTPAS